MNAYNDTNRGKTATPWFTIILVIAAVVAGLMYFDVLPNAGDLISGTATTTPPDEDTNTGNKNDGSGDGSSTIPTGYVAYQNSVLGFSMLIPQDASVSEMEDQSRVEFSFLGPDNEPNSEITDGFTVTVFSEVLNGAYKSTLGYAQASLADTRNKTGNTIVGGLEVRTVNGMTAYRYSYKGALGNEITDYVFLPTDGERGFQVTYSVADPNTHGYETMIYSMLESIQFPGSFSGNPPVYTNVQIALLDYAAVGNMYTKESDGPTRGCDKVVLVNHPIAPTTAPLTAAMQALFSIDTESYEGWQNFIANTNDTLSFDHATVSNGTAYVYLTGELSGLAGVCDNPRAKIQIEETAKQFSTVNSVVLYLNGQQTDLQPGGQGL